MKVVLALEAGEVPPTYGIENLNPNIDFDRAKVVVVKDGTVPWPDGKLRRASVNSFGFGGANGHCIVDHVNIVLPDYVKPGILASSSFPINCQSINSGTNRYSYGYNSGESESNAPASPTPPDTPPWHSPVTSEVKKTASANASTRQLVVLPFSAHNSTSLKLNIEALSQVINQWSLADIAYTLGSRRSRLQQRSFCIVDKDDPVPGFVAEKRVFTSPLRNSNVAYVFTGQSAQWHAMGAQLFDYGVFRATISYLDYVLKELPGCPSWSISATLMGEYEQEHIQSPQVSQVACTALQIAIVDLLASWSVQPVAVVGHSSGEIVAAYASGHITAAEAIAASYFRGQAVSKNKRKGTMLAVGVGPDQVSVYLQGYEQQVKIAAINSPGSTTLSGDAAAVEELSAVLTKENVFNRVLRTSGSAYHSHHMSAVANDYVDLLYVGAERINRLGLVDEKRRYPRIPWISSVKPDQSVADAELVAHYWTANLESPVRFSQAVTKMMNLENGTVIDALIEIGPHAALKGPLEQILKGIGKSAQYVPSLQRNEDGRVSLLQLAGTLFATNAEIDLAAVNSVDNGASEEKRMLIHGCTAIDLPSYQYTYGAVSYYESQASKEYRLRETIRHDLLGSKLPGASKL